MARAAKWWPRSLCGGKKEKERNANIVKERPSWILRAGAPSSRSPATTPVPQDSESWIPAPYDQVEDTSETGEEKKKKKVMHAIEVADADAAMAATQASATVIRLTSEERRIAVFLGSTRDRRRWAAMKIQTVFRGYLARRALRALKGLVRLQAYVRGYLVRRETVHTLHSMQALFQAQAATRRHRPLRSISTNHESPLQPGRHPRIVEILSENASVECDGVSGVGNNKHGLGTTEMSPKNNDEVDSLRQKYRLRHINPILSELFSSFTTSNDRTEDWSLPRTECSSTSAQNTPRVRLMPELKDVHPVPVTSHAPVPDRPRVRSQPISNPISGTRVKKILSTEGPPMAQAGLSQLRVQKPCSPSRQEAFSFKNVVVSRLSRSPDPSPRVRLAGPNPSSFPIRW